MSAQTLQLQNDLKTLGLDPGPLDGTWGNKTAKACIAAVVKYPTQLPSINSIMSESFQKALHALANPQKITFLPPKFVDLTAVAATGWRKKTRKYTDVNSVTLHQTGCPLTDIPDKELRFFADHQILTPQDTPCLMRWAKHRTIGKDGKPAVDKAGNPVYTALKAPFGITYSGIILQIHNITDFGWDAQGLSHNGVGVEFAGLFCGEEGFPETRPGAPASWKTQSITLEQILSGRELIRYVHRKLSDEGSRLEYLHAHRQAAPRNDPKNARPPDPGSLTWFEVAVFMMAELGLSDGGPGWILGTGEPLPDSWTGINNGIPYQTPKNYRFPA